MCAPDSLRLSAAAQDGQQQVHNKSPLGRSSTQHMDQRFVLKTMGDPVMARREECVLSLLRREPWVPELLCPLFEGRELLLRKAGQPLDHTNLPRSWRTQVKRITAGLHSHGIAHNDIWKKRFHPGMKPLMAELVVERDTMQSRNHSPRLQHGHYQWIIRRLSRDNRCL